MAPWFASPLPRLKTALALALVVLCCTTCNTNKRKPVYTARGKVLVGTEPAKDALVVLYPMDEKDVEGPNPSGRVDGNGDFVLSTYADNDGAPAGEYLVTIEWRPSINHLGRQVPGPDRFNGRYAQVDRKNPKLRARIEAKPGNEIPVIKLEKP